MIKWLKIQNYAIIEELEVQFSNGLTIITGETGAGKSILLGALGLLMGNRMDTKSLYDLTQKCIIEGCFNISKYKLEVFFKENDIDYDEELVIRRELTPSGKSRAFANDTPVNLKVLQELSSSLLDLHQQFDTLETHSTDFQLHMLDALAGNKDLLIKYQGLYKNYTRNKRQLEALIEQHQKARQEEDFLNYQLKEFEEASLVKGEQESNEEELSKLSNAEDIKRTLGSAFQHLSESENAVISQLEDITSALGSVSNFDTNLRKLKERFDGIIYELQDVAREFEAVAEETEYNEERIKELQERLDLIYRLQKKHGVLTLDQLLEVQQQITEKQNSFADLSQNIEQLKQTIEHQEKTLFELAHQLSEKRKAIAPKFQDNVVAMLKQLAMEHAQMQIDFTASSTLMASGIDQVNYLFAANKGSRLQAIREVASGGEQSRLALATKSLVASAIPLPTLVFDEIDTGISGHVALKMGEILRNLSNEHQVVSITHSPQVASQADTHYYVYKRVKDDRTVTEVKQLQVEERIHVIAMMLSSDPPSLSALQNARELLGVN